MSDRILKRRDVSGNYEWVNFAIGPATYRAKVAGSDVWAIQRVFRRVPPEIPAPSTENRVRDIMKRLLEEDELRVMEVASGGSKRRVG